MRRFLILTAIFLGAALVVPVAMRADNHHDKRYYDLDAHDYHTWNNQEDRAYRIYLARGAAPGVSCVPENKRCPAEGILQVASQSPG